MDKLLEKLPKELVFMVLEMLPVDRIAIMAMTSETTAINVSGYCVSSLYAKRAALMLSNCDRNTRHDVCHELARPIEHAIFYLHSVSSRVEHVLTFLNELSTQCKTLEEQQSDVTVQLNKCVGEILYACIIDWTYEERKQACAGFCSEYKLERPLRIFLRSKRGHDVANEIFLRQHLSTLLLDRCSTGKERATWISFIIGEDLEVSRIVKLMMLLYVPLDGQGRLNWSFASCSRSFEVYTDTFLVLAGVLGSLRLAVPHWNEELSLEVLNYMSRHMATGWWIMETDDRSRRTLPWSRESSASMIFLLSLYENDTVCRHISSLWMSGNQRLTVTQLLVDVLVVAPTFIARSQAFLIDNNAHGDFLKRIIENLPTHQGIELRNALTDKLEMSIKDCGYELAYPAVDTDRQGLASEQNKLVEGLITLFKSFNF